MICEKCGKILTDDALVFGPDCALCSHCVAVMRAANVVCPVCKASTRPDDDLSLLLTRAHASIQEKMDAPTAIVHICPECHILFFDDFQYDLLMRLKK